MLIYIYFDFKVLDHTVSLSDNMILLNKKVIKIQDKTIGPWNTGRKDLHLFWSNFMSNCLQDVMKNQWTIKNRSQWPTSTLKSNVRSYWFIIPNKAVHTSNNIQDIRTNYWTMKYRLQWPTFILRSNLGSSTFIFPKFAVLTWNRLQDIRQNHRTVKYRSCWPSLHDPQAHVTKLSHVWPTNCISYFQVKVKDS